MVLGRIFSPDLIKIGLESEDKDETFEEMVDLFVSRHPDSSREGLLAVLREREAKLSTGIKTGIALPHAQNAAVPQGEYGVIGISKEGIDYDALDGKPVHVVFMILTSCEDFSMHLRILKRLAILLENPEFYQTLLDQKEPEGVYKTICKFEDLLTTSM